MTIKIMWLHSHITNATGSSKYLYSVISELSKNYQISLYLLKPINYYDDAFNQLKINIVSLGNESTSDPKFWLHFSQNIKNSIEKLRNDASNFDIIISSFFPMNVIANSLNLPHLQLCFQPYAFFWDNNMIKSLPIQKMIPLLFLKMKYSKLDYNATRKSGKILTINEGSKTAILDVYGKKSIPTFMGIEKDIFSHTNLPHVLQNKKIILHSTDWSSTKKTIWLIEQFQKIYDKFNNVELFITETKIDPKMKQHAISIINKNSIKNITFLGTLDANKLSEYIRSANLVVYPGFAKGITTSLFVLECMAFKIPAIVHNKTSEDVEHGKTGYVFSNDHEFQKYVLDILNDSQLQARLGIQAQEYVLTKFNWNNVVSVFEKNILELIK